MSRERTQICLFFFVIIIVDVVSFVIAGTDIIFIFRCRYTGALVLPLYASMSRAQQMAVFQVGLKMMMTAITRTRTRTTQPLQQKQQLLSITITITISTTISTTITITTAAEMTASFNYNYNTIIKYYQ